MTRLTLRLALSQTAGCFTDLNATLDLLDHQASRAQADAADLLLLPELFLTGYNLGADLCARLAITQTDPQFDRLRQIARSHQIALCLGYPERVGAAIANSAALIDAQGELVLNHRKTHLYGALDRAMFSHQGDRFAVADWRGWQVGIAICYDIEFPESARIMALGGADLILVPTALMTGYDVVAQHLVRARAYENQVFLAYANHCGAEHDLAYLGLSSILGPDGAPLAEAGAEATMLAATLDPAHQQAIRARDPLLADRRPASYQALPQTGPVQP